MASRESSRSKLLDAADALLFERGIAATPVDAILERAGVSPATLYRAFGSKEGLLAAALERRHTEWLSVWDAAVDDAGADPAARLLAVLEALQRFRSRPGGSRWCAFLGTAAEYVDPPEVVAATLDRETTALRTRLRRLALPLVDDDPHRAAALAEQILLVVSGALAMRLRPGAAAEPPHDTATGVARALVAQARGDAAAPADAPRRSTP